MARKLMTKSQIEKLLEIAEVELKRITPNGHSESIEYGKGMISACKLILGR